MLATPVYTEATPTPYRSSTPVFFSDIHIDEEETADENDELTKSSQFTSRDAQILSSLCAAAIKKSAGHVKSGLSFPFTYSGGEDLFDTRDAITPPFSSNPSRCSHNELAMSPEPLGYIGRNFDSTSSAKRRKSSPPVRSLRRSDIKENPGVLLKISEKGVVVLMNVGNLNFESSDVVKDPVQVRNSSLRKSDRTTPLKLAESRDATKSNCAASEEQFETKDDAEAREGQSREDESSVESDNEPLTHETAGDNDNSRSRRCVILRHHPSFNSISRRASSLKPVDGHICASCQATKTPYWRDSWSTDLMLCNACGLRFQKFGVRCDTCYYVPRKEEGGFGCACSTCSKGSWIQE